MNKIEIVDRMLAELAAGRAVELAIVTATEGSSPRAAGAWMTMLANGTTVGTVGGGRVEELAKRDAAELLAAGFSRTVRYTMGGRGSDTGMICGGAVSLCYLHLDAGARDVLVQEREILASRTEGVLAVDLADLAARGATESACDSGAATGGASVPVPTHGAGSAVTMTGCPALAIEFPADQRAITAGIHEGRYLEPICPEGFVYIFGCGHVGRALVPVLARAGFVVVACDDRPDFLTEELLPAAAQRRLVDYADLAATCAITDRDLVVSSSATHASDLAIVSQALAMGPAYLGCMGSRKKTAFVRGELAKQGFDPERIEAIHMPIGLPIHAETPEEIAISIAAELIDFRRTALLPRP